MAMNILQTYMLVTDRYESKITKKLSLYLLVIGLLVFSVIVIAIVENSAISEKWQ